MDNEALREIKNKLMEYAKNRAPSQNSTDDQLKNLIWFADQLGFYDASDFLKNLLKTTDLPYWYGFGVD